MVNLSRSAFATRVLFCFGAVIALALGTLHFETAGGAVGYSTPVAVAFMAIFILVMLVATYQRAADLGASVLVRCLAVIGSVWFAPVVTLVLLFLRAAPRGEGSEPSPTVGPLRMVLALPLGVAVGLAVLLLVQAVFKAL